ncbi:hypothetical protein [Amedibacterium intestinale]|uniref:hypothetical protein n=1 Tax=Amedibacterium intestinale TaxID=2583452 RepID=UPI000E202CFB
MCSVIEYYERKTRVEALAEGEVNTTLKDIEKIEKKMNMSLEEAMEFLEIDEELKHRIYVRLGEELE